MRKILVVIANYGTKNDVYLSRLLETYRSMTDTVDVVVLTNVSKQLGEDVEVIVQQVRGDPWSFPFPHKKIFAERLEDYDLFIYSEDDILITGKNIDAFLRNTELLREDEISGFLRMEEDGQGGRYFPDVHAYYHWDPSSVVARGNELFAYFTNEHSASYVLTREQLRRAIRSGGFLVEPHKEKYDLLVTAATDPYTQCGFKKLICISRMDEILVAHLSNKYLSTMGTAEIEMRRHVAALLDIHRGKRGGTALLNGKTEISNCLWRKSYYERARADLGSLLPHGARTVLSYGCGWGETEAFLKARGLSVTAIPLDAVIGASAEARGLEVLYGASESVLSSIGERRFDCVLLSGVLPLVNKPERLLSSLCGLLSADGVMITMVPNMSQLRILRRRAAKEGWFQALHRYETGGLNLTTAAKVQKWLSRSGLRAKRVLPVFEGRAKRINEISEGLFGGWLASEFVIVADRAKRFSEATAASADRVENREWQGNQ
jgi:2-polyprenyl-3-methyl-5-hydroxy-6-metoxy-1,4-benzoquinol methylase